jgi:hypothetical protein
MFYDVTFGAGKYIAAASLLSSEESNLIYSLPV